MSEGPLKGFGFLSSDFTSHWSNELNQVLNSLLGVCEYGDYPIDFRYWFTEYGWSRFEIPVKNAISNGNSWEVQITTLEQLNKENREVVLLDQDQVRIKI